MKSLKEYKKLSLPLLPVERWVGLPKRNSSNAVPKKNNAWENLEGFEEPPGWMAL